MITIEELNRLFDADFETGVLRWKIRPGRRVKIGDVAGSNHNSGYRHVLTRGHHFLIHRLIWAMANGSFPDNQIDHINGVRDDNRLCNLRAVTPAENSRNMRAPKNNRSGVVGVRLHSPQKWVAYISTEYLGLFPSFEGAIAARQAAEIAYGYHENHGRQVSS